MSSSINPTIHQAIRNVPKSNPAFAGVALFVGVAGAVVATRSTSNQASSSNKVTLESQFGTADGYFPSATRGSVLSNPPGNKDHLVGEHYVPLSERRKYTTKRKAMLQKQNTNIRTD